jgi:23S rRNA pseudouridine1911/1915/1917 synthase
MISEIVPAALADQRLDRVVALIADVSRSVASQLIDSGAVRVNGVPVDVGRSRVVLGDLIGIDETAVVVDPDPQPDGTIPLTVVYEDEDLLVIDKPAGLVVHPGAGTPDGTLVNALLARYPELSGIGERERPGIVHRLDAGSSGLLAVARDRDALSNLMAQFADHSAQRRYTGLVWGHPANLHGLIDAPIGRDPRDPLKMAVTVSGRRARTGYRVRRTFSDPIEAALLDCHLETGRTHQIRVHLSSIGHPLIGDRVYSDRASALSRPFLHAASLTLRHPRTSESMTFTAPLPEDLTRFLESLDGATDIGVEAAEH